MIKFDVFFPVPKPYHDEGLIRLAVGQGAMKVVEAVVAVSPGRAKLGWKIRFIGQEAAQVYADQNPPLSLWLEYGTRPHPIDRHGAVPSGVTPSGRELFGPGSGRASRKIRPEDWQGKRGGKRPRGFVGYSTGRPMLRIPRYKDDPGESDTSGWWDPRVSYRHRYAFTPHVDHPGIKPRWYLRQAWQANQFEIMDDIKYAARNKITGELGIYPGAGGPGSKRFNVKVGTRFHAVPPPRLR